MARERHHQIGLEVLFNEGDAAVYFRRVADCVLLRLKNIWVDVERQQRFMMQIAAGSAAPAAIGHGR